MKLKSFAVVTIASFLLAACSTFRPHVNQYKASSFSCDDKNIKVNPKKLADYLRCEYTDVLNDRVTWDRGSGIAIGTALAVSAYKGVTSSSNTNQIAALTTGAAAIYGVNQIFVNDKVSAVYATGIQAVSCVEKKHRSVLRLSSLLDKAERQIIELTKIINSPPKQCANSITLAEDLLTRYHIATSLIEAQTLPIIGELNEVDASVKIQVDQLLPNIDSILTSAKGIPTNANSFNIPDTPESNGGGPPIERKIKLDGTEQTITQIIDPADNKNCNEFKNAFAWYKAIEHISENLNNYDNQIASSDTVCDLAEPSSMVIGDEGKTTYEIMAGEDNSITINIYSSSGSLSAKSYNQHIHVEQPAYKPSENAHVMKVWVDETLENIGQVIVTDHSQKIKRTIFVTKKST